MIKTELDFVKINAGDIHLGTNRGGLFFAADRPRHQVKIEYSFYISEKCIPVEFWNEIFIEEKSIPNYDKMTHKDMERFFELLNKKDQQFKYRLPSESEWELAKSKGILTNIPDKNGELLADQPHVSYWGAPCDGSPWLEKNPKAAGFSMQLIKTRTSKKGFSHHKLHNENIRFRIIKLNHDPINTVSRTLPKEFDRLEILKREFLMAILIGIIPSFIWAYFNASPGYILTGFGNLILGGVFFSLITGLIIRPKHASLEFKQNNLISISPYTKKVKTLVAFEGDEIL